MRTEREVERLAAGLLILSFFLFLGHVWTVMQLGAGRTTIVWVLVYGFAICLAGLALSRALWRWNPTLATLCAFGLGAHGLFIVLTADVLLAGLEFPDEFAHFGGEWTALEMSMDRIRSTSFVFLGLGLLPVGAVLVRARLVAPWLGWLGVVAGAISSLGMVTRLLGVLPGALAEAVARVAVPASYLFLLALGIRLWLRPFAQGGHLMDTERGIERLAGGLLVFGMLLIVGHIVSFMTLGATRSISWVLFYAFPISLAGLALFQVLRGRDATLALFGAFGLVAHGLFVVVAADILLAGLRFPDQFAHFGGEWTALEMSMDRVRSSAFTWLGLGLLSFGIVLARSRAVARWVGVLGAVVGGFAFLVTLSGLAGGPAGEGAPIAAMAALVYMLILGIRLLARPMAPVGPRAA